MKVNPMAAVQMLKLMRHNHFASRVEILAAYHHISSPAERGHSMAGKNHKCVCATVPTAPRPDYSPDAQGYKCAPQANCHHSTEINPYEKERNHRVGRLCPDSHKHRKFHCYSRFHRSGSRQDSLKQMFQGPRRERDGIDGPQKAAVQSGQFLACQKPHIYNIAAKKQ